MEERPVALVTGAAKRLGRHLASHLAHRGFHIVVNYLNSHREADELVAEINGLGGSARAAQADISDKSMVATMLSEIGSKEGRLDLLINNVGNYRPGPLRELTPERWDQCIGANLSGAYYCCYEALTLLEASAGQIINIGYAGLEQNPGTPGAVDYQVSKMGLLSLTRSLALALAPAVRVNMVSPGWIPVERHQDDPEEDKAEYLAGVPLGRWGVPEDIGAACAFLASEEAGFITGQTLLVNGGVTTC